MGLANMLFEGRSCWEVEMKSLHVQRPWTSGVGLRREEGIWRLTEAGEGSECLWLQPWGSCCNASLREFQWVP